MADVRLFSILQVSDLHLGTPLPNGDARLPPALAVLPLMTGQLGHHRIAARELRRFVTDRLAAGVRDTMVVSGDLTAVGASAEFALARAFLGPGPSQRQFGVSLGFADWDETSVSGNHDQWPGHGRVIGWPTQGLARTFPNAFPFFRKIQVDGGVTLTLAMVDSDADVRPVSLSRIFGRGKFESQLAALAQMLPRREDREVRVMVVHHAIADANVPLVAGATPIPRRAANARWRRLEIAPDSLLALEHFVVDHAFQVVMTGHRHRARLTELTASKRTVSRRVLEAQCGATTQRDVYPGHLLWRTQGAFPLPALPANALILHELVERDGALVWIAEIFQRAPGSGFVSSTTATRLPGPTRREMPV